MTKRDFLSVTDLTAGELASVLALADRAPDSLGLPLLRHGVALIFEKPSNRTRHSTEIAVVQLGGHPVYTRAEEVQFDTREPAEDVARIMSGYHSIICARVFSHSLVERLAAAASVPVVNMLSDHSHPLQALADVLTMQHAIGSLRDRSVAWVGDYNNVARSLAEASVMCGAHVRLACPDGYGPDTAEVERLALVGDGTVEAFTRAGDAVKGADAVHTDTWTSMGQEAQKDARKRAFEAFRVDADLMAQAGPGAGFYHCMPAYRGLEVSADVMDGPASRAIEQGHNRLPATRALLAFLMGVTP
jgi:ornithine carbamoyltransferase